jgi:hypothetical protein
MFCGRVFLQTVDIPMGTTCAPLLADLFLSRLCCCCCADNKEDTEQMVPNGNADVINQIFYGRHHDMVIFIDQRQPTQ